ncbi:MAG: helix-turn-helix transcriptional regulator [Gammaproteobacteria bacterium]
MATPTKMASEVKWATRQRYQYIEVMAFYTGVVTRKDVARTFGISDAAATKDLKAYSLVAPDNLIYKQNVFGFVPSRSFVEMFADLSPQNVLSMFAANLAVRGNPGSKTKTDADSDPNQNWIYGISVDQLPLPTRLPDKTICAQLVRAIKNKMKLQIRYLSLSDKESDSKQSNTRIIEPHSLIDNGLRWHVRAYNEESYDFRDFVLSRIIDAQLLDTAAESSAKYDDDWMEYVTLKLQPHPKLSEHKQESLLYDFSAEHDVIEISARKALVAYVLHRLSVDTSIDQSLNPNAFQLVLINRDDIEWFAGWSFM